MSVVVLKSVVNVAVGLAVGRSLVTFLSSDLRTAIIVERMKHAHKKHPERKAA